MSLATRTRWTLRRYWADRLGVTPDAFEDVGVTVGTANEGGIQLFVTEDAVVVGAPAAILDSVEQATDELRDTDEDAVRSWLAEFDAVETVLGPTFYGYADRETFTAANGDARIRDSDARVLDSDDESAFRRLQNVVPDDEWRQGGPQFTPGETVGRVVDDELVAVADWLPWDGLLAHLAVVTHPDHRNAGHGRRVVARATEQALGEGLVPQYRTSDAWPWSVTLAQNLGFERFTTAYLGVCQP
jgi:GNAT superfamily N-acetyltransferase